MNIEITANDNMLELVLKVNVKYCPAEPSIGVFDSIELIDYDIISVAEFCDVEECHMPINSSDLSSFDYRMIDIALDNWLDKKALSDYENFCNQ